jgi:hypothetical protein
MATSVKISNLPPGNFIQSQDEFPVSRSGETFRIAASQIVTEGENIATAPGQGFIYGGIRAVGSRRLLYRPLSGIEGIRVNTVGDTVVISASGQNPVMSNFIGNGSNVTFALTEPRSINSNNYRVDIDGVLQKPQEDYNIIGSNLVFTPQSIPPQNTRITVVSNNLVSVYDMIPSDGTVTTNKIFNNAVSTAKIADNAITTPKLSAQAVTNAKLAFDGGAFGFRNKIINGGMEIDQRNAGNLKSITVGINDYSLDRWYGVCAGASVTHRRIPTTAPRVSYLLRITGATGCTTTWVAQRIESSIASQLAGLPVILSFYAASNALTQILAGYGTPINTQADNWSNSGTNNVQTVNITNTLTRYQISFTMPTEASRGLYISFYSNGPLTAGQTLDITGVQLEEGTTVTPFEQRPIGTELFLCQRYFEYGGGWIDNNTNTSDGAWRWFYSYQVPKRTNTPTITNTPGASASPTFVVGANEYWAILSFNIPGGLNEYGLNFTIDAEL